MIFLFPFLPKFTLLLQFVFSLSFIIVYHYYRLLSRFVNGDLTNIYKKGANSNEEDLIKKKKKVSREFSCKCLCPKRKFEFF